MASAHRYKSFYHTNFPKVNYNPTPVQQPGATNQQFAEDQYDEPEPTYQVNRQTRYLEPSPSQSSADYQTRAAPTQQRNYYEPPQAKFTSKVEKRQRVEKKKRAVQEDLDNLFAF